MKIIPLLCFLVFSSPLLADSFLTPLIDAPKYKWVSLGYSQDIQETGTRGFLLSGGLFPEETGFGFQSYVEGTKLDMPTDNKMVYTLAVESILKWKWLYAGAGVGVSDRKTAVSGTLWNFSGTLGARYKPKKKNWFLDFNVRHRSHAERIFNTGSENSGMTSVNFQWGFTF